MNPPTQQEIKQATVQSIAQQKLFLLEPISLVEAFIDCPPTGFIPLHIASEDSSTPGFMTSFDLLTTLDDSYQWLADRLRAFPIIGRLLRQPTIFIGTTVSEYCVFPPTNNFSSFIGRLLHEVRLRNVEIAIIKDIPCQSPLLQLVDNERAATLLTQCRESEFYVVSGQALAYVPITFASMDDYLRRLSYAKRKDLRRKLRSRFSLVVEEIATGDLSFEDDTFVQRLFELYLNVYEQSKYHFDRLTFAFFCSILRNRNNNGVVFVYRQQEKIIGYNICFIHEDSLVDKYVGFSYPEAPSANLYFVSWFYNLEYALRHHLKYYIAGWTDPEVKASLGANFTFTKHAVYLKNPVLRFLLKKIHHCFESDQNWLNQHEQSSKPLASTATTYKRHQARSKSK